MTIIVLESPLGSPVPNDGRTPITGDWVQITRGKRVTKRQYVVPVTPDPIPESKLVGLNELEELLPDSILIELETIRANANETDAKRAAVTRILNAMARGDKVDVLNGKFTTLMTRLANNTALTAGQATAIVDTLKE